MGSQRTHVLVIRPNLPMVKALHSAGVQVTALWDEDNFWRTKDEMHLAQDIEFVEWRRLHLPGMDFVRLVLILTSLIREKGVQVVHVNALRDLVQAFIAVHFLTPKRTRPIIVAMPRNALSWKQERTAWIAAKMIKYFSDGCVTLASSHREQLESLGVPADTITMIPNSYDRDWLDASVVNTLRSPGHSIRVIYIATLCPEKAQHVLIHAAALVVARHPNVEFILVGEEKQKQQGYRQWLLSLVNSLQIGERVTLTGPIPHLEIANTIANCDIVAFPTLAEMMPRAVIECMTAGKPVVASAVGGILDLIRDRETGLLVQPGDVGGLADAICELIEQPTLADQLASAGQAFVLEYCAPERVGQLFQEFYDRIQSGRRGRPFQLGNRVPPSRK